MVCPYVIDTGLLVILPRLRHYRSSYYESSTIRHYGRAGRLLRRREDGIEAEAFRLPRGEAW